MFYYLFPPCQALFYCFKRNNEGKRTVSADALSSASAFVNALIPHSAQILSKKLRPVHIADHLDIVIVVARRQVIGLAALVEYDLTVGFARVGNAVAVALNRFLHETRANRAHHRHAVAIVYYARRAFPGEVFPELKKGIRYKASDFPIFPDAANFVKWESVQRLSPLHTSSPITVTGTPKFSILS